MTVKSTKYMKPVIEINISPEGWGPGGMPPLPLGAREARGKIFPLKKLPGFGPDSFFSGNYWTRTSDPLLVRQVL